MPEPTVTFTQRWDAELYAHAKAQAKAVGTSLNAWIQQAAQEKLEEDTDICHFCGKLPSQHQNAGHAFAPR